MSEEPFTTKPIFLFSVFF